MPRSLTHLPTSAVPRPFKIGFKILKLKSSILNPCFGCCPLGHQGETTTSFLATLASSSSEEMEAELQERVESSQKQTSRVVEIYETLKSTVDQLKAETDSEAGEAEGRAWMDKGM